MNRRTFIASLLGIPAAIKAAITTPRCVIKVERRTMQLRSLNVAVEPAAHLVMFSTPSGPACYQERLWMQNQPQHLWQTHCHSPEYEKALDDIASRNPGCFERLHDEFYGTNRPQSRQPSGHPDAHPARQRLDVARLWNPDAPRSGPRRKQTRRT